MLTPDKALTELVKSKQNNRDWVVKTNHDFLHHEKQTFTKSFLKSWLSLKMIDETRPDGDLYPEFHDGIQYAMLKETELFFNEVLQSNLSVLNFLDSDFVYVNEHLANLYQIPNVVGTHFRKVELPKNHVRGD